jgi:hypothetical protein
MAMLLRLPILAKLLSRASTSAAPTSSLARLDAAWRVKSTQANEYAKRTCDEIMSSK